METFKSFLEAKGLLDNASPKEIKSARIEFNKLYTKSRNQIQKQKWHRMQILLLKEDYRFFKKVAKSYKMGVTPFIREAAKMYLKQGFIHPNPDDVRALELQIRRIGNNVNQIAFQANSNKHVSQKMMKQLQEQLKEIEDEISQILREPLSVDLLVEAYLQEKPEAAEKLETIIKKYMTHDNQNRPP